MEEMGQTLHRPADIPSQVLRAANADGRGGSAKRLFAAAMPHFAHPRASAAKIRGKVLMEWRAGQDESGNAWRSAIALTAACRKHHSTATAGRRKWDVIVT